MAAVHAAQHLAHRGFFKLPVAKGDGLVSQRQCIAHGAPRRPGQQAQRGHFGSHAFDLQHVREVLADRLGGHRAQVELQAARQHSDRHFLRVGGGQHKFQILGRLFQRLQHGIEGRPGEHVNFVNHEHLEAALHRLVDRLLQQGLHVVDAPVGGGIQLGVIDKPARINVGAGLAHTARR